MKFLILKFMCTDKYHLLMRKITEDDCDMVGVSHQNVVHLYDNYSCQALSQVPFSDIMSNSLISSARVSTLYLDWDLISRLPERHHSKMRQEDEIRRALKLRIEDSLLGTHTCKSMVEVIDTLVGDSELFSFPITLQYNNRGEPLLTFDVMYDYLFVAGRELLATRADILERVTNNRETTRVKFGLNIGELETLISEVNDNLYQEGRKRLDTEIITQSLESIVDGLTQVKMNLKTVIEATERGEVPTLNMSSLVTSLNIALEAASIEPLSYVNTRTSRPCLLVNEVEERDVRINLDDGVSVMIPSEGADITFLETDLLKSVLKQISSAHHTDRRFIHLKNKVISELHRRSETL